LRIWQAAGLGLVLTIGQVVLACALSGETNVQEAYSQLVQWDGAWYADIARHGYYSPKPLAPPPGEFDMRIKVRVDSPFGNVAFFPGYPLLVSGIMHLLKLPVEYALLLVSQLGCWVFWTYLLLFFRRWDTPVGLAALGVLAIVLHPGAFYLVASYSESLYLAALLGFLYWAEQRRWGVGAAALHGFVMTATRLIGLPLIVYPMIRESLGSTRQSMTLRRALVPIFLGGCAGLGSALFFGFCQWRFGQWNLYMKTEEIGWGVRPHYFGVFVLKGFGLHWPHLAQIGSLGLFVNSLVIPATVLFFAAIFIVEWRLARSCLDSGWRQRIGYYVCGALMFYICGCSHYRSMIRFTTCMQAVMVIGVVHLLGRIWPVAIFRGRWISSCLLLLGLCNLSMQIMLTYMYTHGCWVA
jgi:hypothetical protein